MARIVLAQQVLAVIVAIGRTHHRMDVVAGGTIIVIDDAGLMIELDEYHRIEDAVVEGADVVEGSDPGKARRTEVPLCLVIARAGVAVADAARIGRKQGLGSLAPLRRELLVADPR